MKRLFINIARLARIARIRRESCCLVAYARDGLQPLAVSGDRGASILIALFYFLVCALVGGVVLTAATVTSGQLVALEKSQQAYYSVASAAELLRDSIQGGTCLPASEDVWVASLPVHTDNQEAATSMGVWLSALVNQVSAEKGETATAVDSLVVTVPATGTSPVANNLMDVTAQVTVRKDYSIRMVLRPTQYDEGVGAYRVILDIPAALLHGEDEGSIERITWERAVIRKQLSGEVAS